MRKIRDNHLLAVTILGMAGYWTLGWLVPSFILSSSLSVFAILIGAAILWRYSSGVYRVLILGERSRAEDGAHLAALGIPSIAAAIVWAGLFTLAWNLSGQPEHWLGTPVYNFSRLLMVGGCVALYLTPDVQRERLSLPGIMWLLAIVVTAVFTAFVLGAYVGSDGVRELFRGYRASYPTCPSDRSVWVASSSSLYHTETSPYRMLVVPRRCFATPEEAESAGFMAASDPR